LLSYYNKKCLLKTMLNAEHVMLKMILNGIVKNGINIIKASFVVQNVKMEIIV